VEAFKFAGRIALKGERGGLFDPRTLASNRFNGYVRSGKALNLSKKKRLINIYTLGVPLLFCNNIYNKLPH
jgi:hypothetical protein